MLHLSDDQIKALLVAEPAIEKADLRREGWYNEKMELLATSVPSYCPFCKQMDGVEWTEFEVALGDKLYFNKADNTQHRIAASISVICTRCDEEIRKEDLK